MAAPRRGRHVVTPDALSKLFAGGEANVRWERALEGLSAREALMVPDGLPHSVAQVLAHVDYWQAWLLARLRGEPNAWPEHAAQGWPNSTLDTWEADRARFFTNLEALQAATQHPDDQLLGFAAHGVYHLGQVVLIRQAIGAWPPPGGGDTW